MAGQPANLLFSGDPAAERRLAATLTKIDREKKKRESAMTWNQRSFFIKQIFDQDHNLRFVKASQRPKYLECIPPPPPDGDSSWENEEYVFSFKPRRDGSPPGRDRSGRRGSKDSDPDDSRKDSEFDEIVPIPEAQEEDVAEVLTEEDLKKEAEQVEQERLEREKLDRSMGVFGRRREKLKMPILMSGGIKPKPDEEKKPNDDKAIENVETEKHTSEIEKKEDGGAEVATDPLNHSMSSADGSQGGASKPKTRFPVLKVRALGLFALTFKKSESFPPLQSPQQSQPFQLQPDQQSTVVSLPPATEAVNSAAVPPQTAPEIVELPRPGSISLPNSPMIERRTIVRQKSDHALPLDRPKTEQAHISPRTREFIEGHRKSRRGSRRESANPLSERSKRSPQEKGVKSSSAVQPRKSRDAVTKPSTAAASVQGGGYDCKNIWAKPGDTPDPNGRRKDTVDASVRVVDIEEEEVQVIRKIIRTLPTNLMIKTTKRETEARSDLAVMRQRLKDRAKEEMTRRSSLDPRFKKLEKSLCNSFTTPDSNESKIGLDLL